MEMIYEFEKSFMIYNHVYDMILVWIVGFSFDFNYDFTSDFNELYEAWFMITNWLFCQPMNK